MKNTDSLRNIFRNEKYMVFICIFILEICLFVKHNTEYIFETKSVIADSLRTKHKYNMCIS